MLPVGAQFNFPEQEEKVLAFWNEIQAFQTSIKLNEGNPTFSFYDGPPFATGLPHYGHILAGTIKVSHIVPLDSLKVVCGPTFPKLTILTFDLNCSGYRNTTR